MNVITFTNRNSRLGLAIALLLVCTLVSVGAIARTSSDTPLDAKSRASLIASLKEVVAKDAPDPKEAAMVADKWDKHSDLAGKTKSQVIDMLWTDVKSVITDSGVLYQIYGMFSFFKDMPDSQFAAKDPKPTRPLTKAAGVKQLVDATYRMHPYVGIEEQLDLLPGSKAVQTDMDEQRKNRISGFDNALKANKKLTAAQKSFVTDNYDQLIKITDKITEDAIRTNFPTERWIREGLQKSYNAKFDVKELTHLIAYFSGSSGQQFLKYVRTTNMAQMITGNGGTLDLTDADKAEYDRFVGTPIGKKFNEAFMKETIAYEQGKENAVRSSNPNADGFAIYEPANLNKLFNKFVAENFKK